MRPQARKLFIIGALLFFSTGLFSSPGIAGWKDIGPKDPYVAPKYIPPAPPESQVHLSDNADGTLTDMDSGRMWAQADSYADLGHCLNWRQAKEYVKNLRTGNHSDWKMPTIAELASIYDNTKENVMAWDHDSSHPLALDEKFADGAAYWYWSSYYDKTELTDCCSRSLYFVTGLANTKRFSYCHNGGVRAVRRPSANLPR